MLIDDITKQLAEKMKTKLTEEHIRVDEDADNVRIILDYLDNRQRRILQKTRKVEISNELSDKIKNKDFGLTSKSADEIIDEFNHICTKIRKGENLNYNLSGKIFDSREKYKDIMLNVWKIRHIHLSKKMFRVKVQ